MYNISIIITNILLSAYKMNILLSDLVLKLI